LLLAFLGVGCSDGQLTLPPGASSGGSGGVSGGGSGGSGGGGSGSSGDGGSGGTAGSGGMGGTGGTAETNPIPPDRRIDWSNAGVIKPDGTRGIPDRTTVCATVTPGMATAAIQAAINACPNDQVVQFAAGTFTLTQSLTIDHPIVLRGAGRFGNSTTQLTLNGNIIFSRVPGSGGLGGEVWPVYAVDWTAGYSKGTTVITLADTSNLSVGQVIRLDQLNDTHVTQPGYTPIVNETGNEGANGIGQNDGASRDGLNYETDGTHECPRGLQQLVKIAAINGNQVTLDTPLYYTYLASQAPQAFFWAGGNLEYAGIEHMSIDAQFNDFAIAFTFCSNCWARDLAVMHVARDAVLFMQAWHGEVRDSYVAYSQAQAPTNYGVETDNSSEILIENNVFDSMTSPILLGCATSGAVVAYNYIVNASPNSQWLFPSLAAHCSHSYMVLWESNFAPSISYDVIHGSASHLTAFRNRITGYKPATFLNGAWWSNSNVPVWAQAWNRFMSFAGNVLGTTGVPNGYEASNGPHPEVLATGPLPDGNSGGVGPIYVLGYWTGDSTDMTNYDPLVPQTLLRWGNFDYYSNQTHWDPAEIPAGAPVPSTETLPASLYLSARPSWFGSAPFPAIGPDVAGLSAKIPAQLRFEAGTP
jgi:hypothetical protein